MNNSKVVPIAERGKRGEEALSLWLQENNLAFLAIDQRIDSFAHAFNEKAKRPDFLLFLESASTLAVDAKNCAMSDYRFTLNKNEVWRALAFEQYSRLPFWFAFLHEKDNRYTWYWISALQAINKGIRRSNFRTNETFLSIPVKHFVPIRDRHDIGKLLTLHSCDCGHHPLKIETEPF